MQQYMISQYSRHRLFVLYVLIWAYVASQGTTSTEGVLIKWCSGHHFHSLQHGLCSIYRSKLRSCVLILYHIKGLFWTNSVKKNYLENFFNGATKPNTLIEFDLRFGSKHILILKNVSFDKQVTIIKTETVHVVRIQPSWELLFNIYIAKFSVNKNQTLWLY